MCINRNTALKKRSVLYIIWVCTPYIYGFNYILLFPTFIVQFTINGGGVVKKKNYDFNSPSFYEAFNDPMHKNVYDVSFFVEEKNNVAA